MKTSTERLCACGCNRPVPFRPWLPHHKYASASCRTTAYKARRRLCISRIPQPPCVPPPYEGPARDGHKWCAANCGATFQAMERRKMYCSPRCAKRAWQRVPAAERASRRANKAIRHPATRYIHEAIADTAPGLCPYCDEPLPGKRKTHCGTLECRREYYKAYYAGRREADASFRPGPQRKVCACGCGEEFLGSWHKRFAHKSHRKVGSAKRRDHSGEWQRQTGKAPPAVPFHFGKAPGEKPVIRPFRE